MSQHNLDARNCSVNDDGENSIKLYNSDVDESAPLLTASQSPRQTKKRSKIESLRDAIRPLTYGMERQPDLKGSVVDGVYDSGPPDESEEGELETPPHLRFPSITTTIEELGTRKQSSLVTIFSIWSTMMGTSILAIPWAVGKSGFACGIVLLVVMAALCLYTAHLVVRSKSFLGLPSSFELDFTDICKYYMGRWGEWISVLTSMVSLICASIVYWILMSNFLFNNVDFIYDKIMDKFNSSIPLGNETAYDDVVCILPSHNDTVPALVINGPSPMWALTSDPTLIFSGSSTNEASEGLYEKIWNLKLTVPMFLVAIIFPLLNFKSPTFFTKTSAFGSISLLFLFSFVLRKAFKWGIHLNFEDTDFVPAVPLFRWSFPMMSGMLSLAYFIHNCILSILRNNKYQENNARDLTIGFVCVMATLMFIGITFFVTFPLDKNCLSDNLLNNLVPGDNWAFTVRVVLLVQLILVFPMIAYVFRIQVMKPVFGSIYPSLKHVLVFNVLIVSMCVATAIFFPHIGSIIRYCGSVCGFGYVFTLPSLVLLFRLRDLKRLHLGVVAAHALLIGVGAANCISQFVM